MKKKLLIIVFGGIGLLAVAILAVVFYLYMNLDSLVRSSTEKAMSYAMQVDCKVGGAHVDIGASSIEFSDILIPNPQGFKTSHAMKFGLVKVQADINSFKTQEPVINLIQLTKPDIIFETTGTNSNLQTLMKSSMRFSTGEEEPAPAEEEKAYKIDKILLESCKISISTPLAGGTALGATLPNIEMNDFGGKDEDGMTTAEAVTEFLNRLLKEIGKVVGDLPGQAKELVEGALAGAGDLAGDAAGEAKKAANSVIEGVGGLLGGKKEEEEK